MYAYNQRLLARRASLLSVLPRSRADQLYGTALCNLTEGDGVPRETISNHRVNDPDSSV